MKKYLYIGMFGALGAILRVYLKGIQLNINHGKFPLNTLLINISGSFLIALILTFAAKKIRISENLRLGLTTGFTGAFTTFSTLCKEAFELIHNWNLLTAALYILLSISLGLFSAYMGVKIGNLLSTFITSKDIQKSDGGIG